MIADACEIEFSGGLLRLRPETEADEAFRFALFCASRPPEEDFSPLGPELAQHLLRQQFRAQNHGYRADFPQARFAVVEFDDAPVGHVIVDVDDTQMRVVDLAIVPDRRSAGLGEAVLHLIIAEARHRKLPLRASVLNGNQGSLRFCRRLGFEPIGEPTAFHTELEWRGV
ncbi:MAG TPA: GNAT family N-acetyltransferase [Methylocystis sp.]|nr:GNAT family N-acetyltransferase [Methylocystis sp.]